jgi:hypothetical protein
MALDPAATSAVWGRGGEEARPLRGQWRALSAPLLLDVEQWEASGSARPEVGPGAAALANAMSWRPRRGHPWRLGAGGWQQAHPRQEARTAAKPATDWSRHARSGVRRGSEAQRRRAPGARPGSHRAQADRPARRNASARRARHRGPDAPSSQAAGAGWPWRAAPLRKERRRLELLLGPACGGLSRPRPGDSGWRLCASAAGGARADQAAAAERLGRLGFLLKP